AITVSERPIVFPWSVDQRGYKLERRRRLRGLLSEWLPDDLDEWEDVVVPAGGPPRHYYLEDDALWRKFAEICVTPDGVLSFTSQYGGISEHSFPTPTAELLKDFFRTADIL